MWWYVLKDKRPVQCTDVVARVDLNSDEYRVAFDDIGDVRISTVFLGLDHDYAGHGPSLLFETMIFGGRYEGYQTRYSTWIEAKVGHAQAVDRVRRSMIKVVNGNN